MTESDTVCEMDGSDISAVEEVDLLMAMRGRELGCTYTIS